MQFANVKNINYFKHLPAPNDAHVMRFADFRNKYNFEPDGVNFYISMSAAAKTVVDNEGLTGLNATHLAFFNNVLEDLASGGESKSVVLALEPLEAADPFGYVDNHLGWARNIAADLSDIRQRAGNVDMYIRYASEMNDRGNKIYGHRPDEYRQSFALLREAFREVDDKIKFSFSPALRADIDESELTQYWPGSSHVDVIAGTWYVGSSNDFTRARDVLRKYILHRVDQGKPFGISEIGGAGANGKNDPMLKMMFSELNALSSPHGVQFDYVTLFLDARWGANAQLDFLRS
jgi:hypothetical protein